MPLQPGAQAAVALRKVASGMRAAQALYVAAELNTGCGRAVQSAEGRCGCASPSNASNVFASGIFRVSRW
jgi:hypothetical protein